MSATVVTTTANDNENNAHAGAGDGDMGTLGANPSVSPFYALWTDANPVEFNIPVTNLASLTGATLQLDAYDVDPSEVDQVYVNGHFVGNLKQTGGDGTTQATNLVVPLGDLVEGNNLVTIYNINVHSDPNAWWFAIADGALITHVVGPVTQGTGVGDYISGDDSGGDNTIRGGGGPDTLDGGGGGGFDTVDYSDKTAAVVLALAGGTQTTVTVGGVAEDLISRFQGAIGGSAGDTLTGDGNANRLVGNGGDDQLHGAGGNDFLDGGAGNDLYDGGAGSDTADFSGYGINVAVDLSLATPQSTGAGLGEDTYASIENLQGGSGSDLIRGNSADNDLYGGYGNDELFPGGASYLDRLFGGDGIDVLHGEGSPLTTVELRGDAGSDWASFSGISTNVTASLANTTYQPTGASGYVKFFSIENLAGGKGDDTLTGDAAPNDLSGDAGNDDLDGGGGEDFVNGQAGGDSLQGGDGGDVIFGGDGSDTIAPDRFLDLRNALVGQGNDAVYGGAGDDTVMPEACYGGDSYYGGAGIDLLDFSGYDREVNSPRFVIDLRTTSFINAAWIDHQGFVTHGTDAIVGFEDVIGTDFSDVIVGNDADEPLLAGGAGDDAVDGGGGNDAIYDDRGDDESYGAGGNDEIYDSLGDDKAYGGDGSDIVSDANGNDTLDGGAGVDTLWFAGFTPFGVVPVAVAITVSLDEHGWQTTGAGKDKLTGFENVVGGDGSDQIFGDGGKNTLSGGDGADSLYGGNGDDILSGNAGRDRVYGGYGSDLAYYADRVGAVAVTLNGSHLVGVSVGGVVEDSIKRIENVSGGSAGDQLGGDGSDNTFFGNGGNDALTGADGADILHGGAGNDALRGGSGKDTFVFDTALASGNVDGIGDFGKGDKIALDDGVFAALHAGKTHKLPAGAFTTDRAHPGSASLIYDQASARLFYDADKGGAGAPVLFATIGSHGRPSHPHLTAHDFDVV